MVVVKMVINIPGTRGSGARLKPLRDGSLAGGKAVTGVSWGCPVYT